MRMNNAKSLIMRATGYRVTFERREGGLLHSDHFPERDEPAIADEEDAWKLAGAFADVDPSVYVNIYVISAFDWTPVEGYAARRLNTYPPRQVEAIDPPEGRP